MFESPAWCSFGLLIIRPYDNARGRFYCTEYEYGDSDDGTPVNGLPCLRLPPSVILYVYKLNPLG